MSEADTFDPFSAAAAEEEAPAAAAASAAPVLVASSLPEPEEADEEEQKVPVLAGASASSAAATAASSAASSSVSASVISSLSEVKVDPFAYVPPTQLGPTPLSLWEAERKNVIQARIDKAAGAKAKRKSKAKDQIAAFYKERKETIAKSLDGNVSDEKAAKSENENLMKHGTTWEKVAKQCSLKPKENEHRDVDRMRKLLIQMKNEKSESKSDS